MINNESIAPVGFNKYFNKENFNYRVLLAIIAIVIAVLFVGFFVYNSIIYRTEISEFDLNVSTVDVAGITPDSHFILKSSSALTAQVLEKYIKINPETFFRVEKLNTQENTFEIIPNGDLQTDSVYTIQINKGPLASHDFSWAYQVKAPFQITSSIPGDKGTDVPLNTGIEIYFNRNDIVNPQSFIEINPKVQGKFDVSENMIRFVPEVPLNERTIYTIKIKSGLGAKDTSDILKEDNIIQFQTVSTYSNTEPSAYFSRKFSEFKPDSDVVLGINAYNTTSVSVAIYKFNSAEEYIDSVTKIQGETPWARFYQDVSTTLPENKKVFTGPIALESLEYSSLLRLPQSLPTGYYAAMVETGKTKDVSWFQVNPISSFAAFASSKSLIWLKDSVSGKNITGVSVVFANKEIGQTNSDGVALFDTPKEIVGKYVDYYSEKREFIIAKSFLGNLVIPMENQYGYAASLGGIDKWWNYVSLNKNIYLPTDTLHFWAIEKSRIGQKSDGDISVKLTNPFWSEDQKGIVTYAETIVKASEYNTVTGELSFSGLKPGVYDLTFRKEDEIVAKQTVTVSSYIKPAYKITAIPDKNIMFAGESVTFKVKAEFFDKTPVANVALSYSTYGISVNDNTGDLILNSKGEGSFTLVPKYTKNQTYWPAYLGINISPKKAEEGQIETSSAVFVFGPHINNSISQVQNNKEVKFSVKTREVVLDGNYRGEPYWNSEDYLGNAVNGFSTKVDISEIIYLKNKTGTNYDPINKVSYPVYEYKQEDLILSSQKIISNSDGISQITFTPESKKTYKFVFSAQDNFGREIIDTRYVYGGYGDYDYSLTDSSYYLANLDSDKEISYKIGDQINLQLQTYRGVKPPDGNSNYIFIIANNGNIEYKVQDTPKYSSVFQSKDVPNIGIWPGWFSQGRFHNSYLKNLSFDANEKRLNIKISKDKESYKPGETVGLNINVTDKNNKPVKAEVNLSALDEAVFSVKPDEVDIISNLYRDIYSSLFIRTSNMPPYGGGGAEKGGGDGDTPRSNIAEIAIYKTITTDNSGYSHVEFKLPDNITSWRLTSQAVTKDLFAGRSVSFIPVTLPFFIDSTLNNTYLADDLLTLRLRTFGTDLGQGTINYSVESPTLSFKKIEKRGSNEVETPLGILTAGIHEITMRASNTLFSDALTRKVKVLDSYFTKNTSDFYKGFDGLKIKSNSTGYTKLTFSSYGQGKLYNELKSLSYQYGVRLDQKGAEGFSINLLNSFFGEKNDKVELPVGKYQTYTGGLKLLPYSSDELELSAISAHLFDEAIFDRSLLKTYFNNSLNDKKTDISRIALSLYGLSSFKEPILIKIQAIKNSKELTIKDRIFVALSLDSIGAKEEARIYYRGAIKPYIEVKNPYSYVGGLKGDETIITTALAAVLAVSLDEPEASSLSLYTEQNQPKETLDNFERLLYIKKALPKLDSEEINFTYSFGSTKETKTLENGESFELTLSPEQLDGLELSNIKGELGIVTSYEKKSSSKDLVKDSNLYIHRAYSVNNIATTELNDGDLVKVGLYPNFSANSLNGIYQIIDYLPSGLRPMDEESTTGYYNYYGNRVYPTEIDDQKVTFIVDKSSTLPIYYYARVVSKGVYKAEPAILQSLNSLDSLTISNEDKIIIK